jgi:hypothetical protein
MKPLRIPKPLQPISCMYPDDYCYNCPNKKECDLNGN